MKHAWVVTAICIDPRSGAVVVGPRAERIESDNELFAGCESPWQVEDRYEAFWNRLNDWWETDFPPGKEKVKVLSVVRAA
jgi:hypothetical protein